MFIKETNVLVAILHSFMTKPKRTVLFQAANHTQILAVNNVLLLLSSKAKTVLFKIVRDIAKMGV